MEAAGKDNNVVLAVMTGRSVVKFVVYFVILLCDWKKKKKHEKTNVWHLAKNWVA